MVLTRSSHHEVIQEDGFTLMELLVVMLIFGILSTIAVPSFLDQRKESADSEVRTTLAGLAMKADLIAPRNFNTQSLTMEAIKSMDLGSTALGVGAVVGVSGNVNGGYCLTAYHPNSTHTQAQPLILDSKLGNRFVYNAEDLGGGACDPEVWGSPIQPAHEVREVDGKPTLVPVEAVTPRTNACHGVTPYQYGPDFRATTTTGEHVDLEGSISLSDDCRELRYNVRVVQASENRQYAINLTTMNRTPGGYSSGTAALVMVTGTAETTGVIETGWKQSSNWNQLLLGPTIQDGRYARDILWAPQP